MNKQNFQPGGVQVYCTGHSSFCGTRSNDANPNGTLDDDEDTPGAIVFSLS